VQRNTVMPPFTRWLSEMDVRLLNGAFKVRIPQLPVNR
jgi:hypothetical protein